MAVSISFYLQATKRLRRTRFENVTKYQKAAMFSGVFKMFSSIRVALSRGDTNSFAFNEAKQRDHISS